MTTWFLTSCETDAVCHQEMETVVQISLHADSINMDGKSVQYTQWDSITIWGVGHDIGMRGKNTKAINLELRADTTLTSYLIHYHNQIDTLYIKHTPRHHYISLACGCAVYHTITAAWSSDSRIDSIAIINASVETTAQENLCIYLHE